MTIDVQEFYQLALERTLEVARYQKLMCGKMENLQKSVDSSVTSTTVNSALTYLDMFTQDYLMVPLLRRFPNLVPLVEEDTGLKRAHLHNDSDETLLIDPIDGTAFFLEGKKDYSIMVGLLRRGRMVVGIGCYPETNDVYAAIAGEGAWKLAGDGTKTVLPSLPRDDCDKMHIVCHYRFLQPPYDVLANALTTKGYRLITHSSAFGTGLTGILRLCTGESCAFITPHLSLHDFGVPSLMVQEAGGIVCRFDYSGYGDIKSWTRGDDTYTNLNPMASPPRYRVLIADSNETVERILKDMGKEVK